MERALKIPEFLAHLKIYGGYPGPVHAIVCLWRARFPRCGHGTLRKMPEEQTLCYLWSAPWRVLLFHRRAVLKKEPAVCRPSSAQAMRRVRLADLPVSEWTKT
jgi:hypothetical protein